MNREGEFTAYTFQVGTPIHVSVMDNCVGCVNSDPTRVRGRLQFCKAYGRFYRTNPFCAYCSTGKGVQK